MNDRFTSIQLFARVARSGSFSVAAREMGITQPTAAAVAGLGILSTGQRSVQAELASGQLVHLLPECTMGSADIRVILLAGRAAKPSARAFANFIAAEIAQIEAQSPWGTKTTP